LIVEGKNVWIFFLSIKDRTIEGLGLRGWWCVVAGFVVSYEARVRIQVDTGVDVDNTWFLFNLGYYTVKIRWQNFYTKTHV